MTHGQGGRGALGLALTLLLLSSGGSLVAQDREPAAEPAERREVRAGSTVHCLLPAKIDRLGSQLTKLGPRRTIETTVEDCGERQGEVVEEPR